MYENILVPTDGSEQTDGVLSHAFDLAERYGATVHGLYVVDSGGLPTPDPEMREELLTQFQRTAETATADVEAAATDAGVDVVTATGEGAPSAEIIEYAEDNDIDLIVMGTHGRTGLSHVLLGSVAENVVRHSPVPVLMVRVENASR